MIRLMLKVYFQSASPEITEMQLGPAQRKLRRIT